MSRDPLALGAPLGDQHASTPSPAGTSPQTTDTPSHPALHHTRTAPTTFPINPAAHAHSTGAHPPSGDLEQERERGREGSHDTTASESPTPTLAGGVPASAGGLHGQPQPGSKAAEVQGKDGEFAINEKDHQATRMGPAGGVGVAALAKQELDLDEKHGHAHSQHHLHRKQSSRGGDAENHGEDRDQFKKIERTATGTRVTHNTHTGAGEEVVQGRGMVPLHRQHSTPPAVGLFGGVAPTGVDAEEGLRALRSREDEEERDATREEKGPDPWAVTFEPGDRANPKNWGVLYRWCLTGIAGLLVLNSTFASSSPSGIIQDMMEYFGFSQEVAILTISLFVAGYCVGPILWGPLSESYGRRPIFILSFVVYTGFQVGCALSKNTASILIFRFLGGMFAAAPLTNSGALLADIWDGDHRGQAMSIFALAPFAGPSIGPIVAGAIQVTGTDWRWMYWILTIFAGFCLAVIVFLVPETYAPKILAKKAKKLRKDTQEQRWYAPLERADKSWKARINDILFKPFIILALEPMLMAVTLYMSFVYGVVYLLFEAYPFVFVINHGFNNLQEGLAFLGFFTGGFLCVVLFMTVIEPRFQRHAKAVAPLPPKPEMRLELCVISGWSLVIAMFWFGWTSYSSIHWISPVIAGGLIGVGTLGMFVSLFNYIIDVYLWSAASALAGATVVRSLFGAAFPLFATQMYEKLGTQWASSLLGFLALLLAPIPIVLMIYGSKLRARSRFSPNKTVH
ncbi:polyamine transporter 1 [Kwoniella heveanensis BCC8398]|uniref:Polyamine transporter 1 n=1 Tax=Kwoniella heveanensis BCC8398 TaxID=1296120 RepID=A0A1B9GNV3_9TREE|nr:polyamine transporter 1 [Kwoniella heveanensis BCC8398]